MKRKIIEYEIISSQELGDFENSINDKLKEGYELYSHPNHIQEEEWISKSDKRMYTTHYQAMVKYEQIIDKIFEGAI